MHRMKECDWARETPFPILKFAFPSLERQLTEMVDWLIPTFPVEQTRSDRLYSDASMPVIPCQWKNLFLCHGPGNKTVEVTRCFNQDPLLPSHIV